MDTEKQPRNLLTNDKEPSAEYWQARVEHLQEAVCFLLMKNQTMRMALSAEKHPNQFSESLVAYTTDPRSNALISFREGPRSR